MAAEDRINIFPDKVKQAANRRLDKQKMPPQDMNPSKKADPTTKRKIASIERELRGGEMRHSENIQAPLAGARPTPHQRSLQNNLSLNNQDARVGSNANPLGDYSNLLGQDSGARRQSLEVLRAMDIHTLNSKSDVERLLNTNASFMDHTSQYGLAQIERKAYSKLKKSGFSKLQSQTMY